MKRRIIIRIVLGLVILLALVLCVTKVIIPLFDTSDELKTYVPEIHRFAGSEDTFRMESENLVFDLNPETTHFTLTDNRTGKVWSSQAPDVASDAGTMLVEKNRLQSVLTVNFMNGKVLSDNFNTFEHSVANRLYAIEKLEDGSICVTYTIGKISREYLYPDAITDVRMQSFLANLSKSQQRTITDAYQAKGIDPVTGKDNYKKNDDRAALEAQYPDLKDGVVWVLRKAKADEKNANTHNKREAAFAAAGYTSEDFEYDASRIVRDGAAEGATDKAIFNISVIYRLEGNDLVVELPLDDITYNPEHPLTAINVLPAFGAAGTSETGYILVPEGSGAIINFNNGKTRQNAYYADMYGWDWATIRKQVPSETRMIFPVFGMATQGNAFVCIIEDGKSWAGVNADISGRDGRGSYNSANAVYTILHKDSYDVSERTNKAVYMFETELPEGKLVQRYRFVPSDSYMDMAAAYREYLLANNPQMNREVSAEAQTVIELVGAIDKVQQRFGVPTNVPIALTTYKQAQELLNRLLDEDLPNLSVRYAGWMNGGLNQSILNDVRLMSEMGSAKELKELTRIAQDAGVPLYFDGLVGFARNSGLLEGFLAIRDAAKHTTREEAEIPEYSTIWYGPQSWRDTYFLLKPSLAMSNADVLSRAAQEYGATGVSFRDLGNMLSADYDPKDTMTREAVRLQEAAKIAELQQKGQLVMTRSGNDYAAVQSDIVTDIDFDGLQYRIFDEMVPFYPAALHGSVPYTGVALNLSEDREELLLRSAEMGASLQYSLMASNVQELQDSWFSDYYGADVSIIYDDMIQTLNAYNKAMSGTFDQQMVGHERTGNVTTTEYENGIRVYVNFGYVDAEVDGLTIPARSYHTVKEAVEE